VRYITNSHHRSDDQCFTQNRTAIKVPEIKNALTFR